MIAPGDGSASVSTVRPAARGASARGATAVEYALILPVLLLFLLGIMDVGRLAWTQATLKYATAAAARCAAINATACATTAQIQAYGAAHAYAMDLAASDFTVTTLTCGRSVSVSTSFGFVTPWIAPMSVTLAADACYPVQPS
jgi:Flp pilus assembly protein TadG